MTTTASARPAALAGQLSSPFVPRAGLSNGHVMTVVAWARRRAFGHLAPPEARLVRVSDDTQVLAHCHWQADRSACPTLVALHGLEGSSSVHYMRGLASKGHALGWNVVLLNQRNCGGTEHLTPSLYHSGLTADPFAVMRSMMATDALKDFGVVGYSLGGNIAAKLAAEVAETPDVPVRAVVSVCPTMDLDRCVRSIERRQNVIYEYNFVRNLKARMRRKAAAWPGSYDLAPLDGIKSIRRFDDVYTAPHHGFGDAANYYRLASALRIADRVRIPLLIVAAEDDPFVPAAQFGSDVIRANSNVHVEIPPHGGHCGFIASRTGNDDGYWAERRALSFLTAVMPASGPARAADR